MPRRPADACRSLSTLLALTLAAAACGAGSPPSEREGAPAPSVAAPAEPAGSMAATPPAPPAAPAPAEVAARLDDGVDVSGYSGTVDWTTVLDAGHSFAFVKATEGMDLRDPEFDTHWSGAGEAGMIRGAYHFYVTEDDPVAQAEFFISTVELAPGDLAPVVDVETLGHDTGPGLADRLRTFLDRLEAHYGVKPILYTSAGFWDSNLSPDFGDHPLWVAEYGVEEPRLPAGWSEWHLWQWQGDATVPGVEKSADLSRVNRDGPDLTALVVPVVPVVPVAAAAP